MRILIVHNLLWAHYKAAVFQALARLVREQPGVQMLVLQIARNERSRAGLETKQADAPQYEYPYELLFDTDWENVGVLARTRALLRHTLAFRPDVINLTGYYDPAQLILLLYAKLRGIRVILQNESTTADRQRGGPKEWFKRRVVAMFDGFFCFGTHSADYVMDLGAPPATILMRKNAVDSDAIAAAYHRLLPIRAEQQQQLSVPGHNFVFIGRLIDAKNLPTLLNAFAAARKQALTDWGLLLLGEGPLHDALTEQISELGLMKVVRLFPGRPWYEVAGLLTLSDVLVLPSTSEPWGLVVNEAMVCGLPVIVSDRCGCAVDLVRDGENGFVIDPDHPEMLTRCLLAFMNATVDQRAMGRASQRLIEPYAPNAVATDMLAGFRRVTAS
ncbi:MAG: glycosyltransferase [Bacteroidetes bacterium]|nr:glycosyltransferase [Fibrella sp.]